MNDKLVDFERDIEPWLGVPAVDEPFWREFTMPGGPVRTFIVAEGNSESDMAKKPYGKGKGRKGK